MGLSKAKIKNISRDNGAEVDVLFNPTDYSITTNMNYAEINVPGLRVPLMQFVRGDAQVLAAELFLDRSTSGDSLKEDLDQLRQFVTIDEELHAPPVCSFKWGDVDEFRGVITNFQEKFLLFNEDGKVLRARVTLSMKSYHPAELQYQELNLQSPDRTKTRIVQEGERLDIIADQEYGDATLWTVIAEENGITRPRLIQAGDVLTIPPL
ncbi:LysM peptidoglycan-binding domain-containing protein [Teredinibacter sp. KSP-S5-2]|uniref:CIS tube protein n=1 Tax=Teredinibacter sp. KSP-S5-2 TaxID=3034506 RepID=UPI002934F864|nr:LysM peptidoglycan-binding domain-containing protein [Teredinibacter sp. KSP-S5-2]WNO11498.1 LysM peptidoglycan-binding domain-containing protein [Teredinibacter sp. KSP-S5-2]